MIGGSAAPLLPAAYAWQVYGLGAGVAVYILLWVTLVALNYACVMRDWSPRRLRWSRGAVIVGAMLLIGLSAMENCNIEMSTCHRVFGP